MGRRSYLSTDLARPFRGDCPAITGRMTCSSDVGHRCWAVIDIVLGGYDSLRRRSSRRVHANFVVTDRWLGCFAGQAVRV